MKENSQNRHHVGDTIDFALCDESKKVFNHIFFKKDGGWGIANKNGEVIISNHLTTPFGSQMGIIDDSLMIEKDIDTGLYGVISRKYAKEVIPFEYTFIESIKVEYPSGLTEKRRRELPFGIEEGEEQQFYDAPIMKNELLFLVNKGGHFSKVKDGFNYKEIINGGLWGLYKESGNMLIGVRYYDIRISRQFIECISSDDFLYNDYDYDTYGSILSYRQYIGKIDLFTIEGDFIVGGVDIVTYHGDYIKLYIGIDYEKITETRQEKCFDGFVYSFDLFHNKPKVDNSACLILDKRFKPLLKADSYWFEKKFHIGMTFKGKEDFCNRLAGEIILNGCSVDMQSINKGLLFLEFPDEQFFITEFKSESKEFQSINFCCDGQSEYVDFLNGKWEDQLIEEKVCVIVKLSDDGSILWSHRVNEVGMDECNINMFYREGVKVGIFTENGFRKSMYSAISKKRQSNGKLIVAIKENTNQDIPFNPNYNHFDNSIIRYYEINEKEEMIKIEDNWNIFDPRKYNWFPEKFKEENHLFYDYENYEDGNNCTSGWTRQELEDAADIAYEGHSRLELGLD